MSAQPTLIPEPWANHGSRTNIPETTSDAGRASWALGFPPETAQPLSSGGVPPHWLDFQGVLYALSAHAIFGQVGGRYRWTDSADYPVGACIIDSSGNVYQALQESGPGTDAGAKNPASAANADYWGQMAAPDGTTIKVVNRRLTAVDQSTSAADLADNVTTIANDNKLTVNLTNATATALKNISQYLVENGGGLKMNTASGELFVDFENMPTAKFEALLKSLKMQIPLEANKTIYVATNDPNASDVIEDGRGTQAKPFKTIQAAVTWATQTYAVNRYIIYIRIKAGTYEEDLTLPIFTRTSGSIVLRADDYTDPPVLLNATPTSRIITCTGGYWHIFRLVLRGTREAQNDGLEYFENAILVRNGELDIRACSINETFSGAAPTSGQTTLRPFAIEDNGRINITYMADYGTTIEVHQGNANRCEVFSVARQGSFVMFSTNVDNAVTTVDVLGEYTVFASVVESAHFELVGGAAKVPAFVVPSGGTVTGKRYEVATGSGISILNTPLPGSSPGSADALTCGWYQGP